KNYRASSLMVQRTIRPLVSLRRGVIRGLSMPKNVIRPLGLSTITSLALLQSTAAHAQALPDADASTSGMESGDIVVTAQRREQKLQDVPIAITAVSAEELSSRNVSDLQSISSIAPSVQITGAGGVTGNHQVAIRGISGQG